MSRADLIRKLLDLAGDNPQTPEQITAYRKAKQMLEIDRKPSSIEPPKKLQEPNPSFLHRLWYWLQPKVESIPWESFYQREPDDFVTYEITPTPSVRNHQTAVLAKIIATFYRKPSELRSYGAGSVIKQRSPYRCNFRIVMQEKSIRFYLLVPRDKAGEVLRKAEAIYDSGITIREVDRLPSLDPKQVFCTELGYKNHDIFAIDANATNNYPLPSLLTAVRTLEGDDVAIFDALIEPYSYASWFAEAKKAHTELERGIIPGAGAGGAFLRWVHGAFEKGRRELADVMILSKERKKEWQKKLREESRYAEAARIRSDMMPITKRKQGDDVLKTWLRIAVQSSSQERARQTAYTIANAWKDVSGDNSLERFDVPAKWSSHYLKAIETRKGFSIRMRPNKMGVEEAGKLFQLPGKELIQEFPQIQAKNTKEVDLPDEITQSGVRRVRFGEVDVRGKKYLVGQPLEAYGKIKRKAVYDALCSTTFAQGKQGSGKSEGFGAVWAYDMVRAGFSVFIIDTADGQVLRNFVNSLPNDYPDEKLHLLNLDNQAWAVALGWDDVYGRSFATNGADEELAALLISERITARFVGFINSLSKTGEFTDRMKQYVVSCMRAITTRQGWSFLDLELALTSVSYRAELLDRDEVKAMPEVVNDLLTLQEKSLDGGKEKSITDPILSRIRTLSATPFLEHLFYQPPNLKEDGTPVLDMRHIMDNPEGGYGHVVCVQASFDAWNEAQGVILGFMDDKINFNVFSRIDVDQDERKPFLKWTDEPHKIRSYIEHTLAHNSVEFRKYRCKQLLTNHSIEQMGAAANALLDGGAQITSYKTERLSELSRYMHMFKPYERATELYDAIPEKHVAINTVRLPSGKHCPAFIAHMVAPPSRVKDRSYAWQQSAERYGRPWKEVRSMIQSKRLEYQEKDKNLLEEVARIQEEALQQEKDRKAEEKRQQKAREAEDRKASKQTKGAS